MEAPKRFNQKIAKQIAQKQFDQTLDCILGVTDPDYSLSTDLNDFEQNFEEDLLEIGVNPSNWKIESITKHYGKLVEKAKKALTKMYSK